MIITNGNVFIKILNLNKFHDLEKPFMNFLIPYFWKCKKQNCDLSITFRAYEDFFQNISNKTFKRRRCIRRSSAKPFNLFASINKDEDEAILALDQRNRVAYKIYKGNNSVEFFSDLKHEKTAFFHLIEFFRYLVLFIEESKGTLILHGSAVKDKKTDSCFIILGHKGAGKTSTMLDLVINGGYDYFSGDKVLVSIKNEQLIIRGWPDYPHIGLGTLKNYPGWCSEILIDINLLVNSKGNEYKILIDPSLFKRGINFSAKNVSQAAYLLFPSFMGNVDFNATYVNPSEKNENALSQFIESASEFESVNWYKSNISTKAFKLNPSHPKKIMERLISSPWIKFEGSLANSKSKFTVDFLNIQDR